MMRHFFFVFLAWGAGYLSVFGLLYGLFGITSFTDWQYAIAAFVSAFFAFWLERRMFHEED